MAEYVENIDRLEDIVDALKQICDAKMPYGYGHLDSGPFLAAVSPAASVYVAALQVLYLCI